MGKSAPIFKNMENVQLNSEDSPSIKDLQPEIRYKDGPNQYLSIALMNNESAELSICGCGMWRLADTCVLLVGDTFGGGTDLQKQAVCNSVYDRLGSRAMRT